MAGSRFYGLIFFYGGIAPEHVQMLGGGTADALVRQKKHCGRRTVCASARHAARLEGALVGPPKGGGGADRQAPLSLGFRV